VEVEVMIISPLGQIIMLYNLRFPVDLSRLGAESPPHREAMEMFPLDADGKRETLDPPYLVNSCFLLMLFAFI
jgi:hypothetical protein